MFNRLVQFFNETVQELKRVSWPSMFELKESTVVVLVTVFVITVFLYAVDKVFDIGIRGLTSLIAS